MSTTIETWRDPYGQGFYTCKPERIEIKEGLTVLVGCNGSGKTTLLHNMKSELKKNGVPVACFDNQKDGGASGLNSAFFNEDFDTVVAMKTASEGEGIGVNIGNWVVGLRNFIISGDYKSGKKRDELVRAFRVLNDDETAQEYEDKMKALKEHPDRWMLIDAADSGYSVDNVVELKELFNLIIEDARKLGKTAYIIISANEYELARYENCFDVNTGKYIVFLDYEDYRQHILESRDKKNRRYKILGEREEQD